MERPIYEIPVEDFATPSARRASAPPPDSGQRMSTEEPPAAATTPAPDNFVPVTGAPGYEEAPPPRPPGVAPPPSSASASATIPPPTANPVLNFPPPVFAPAPPPEMVGDPEGTRVSAAAAPPPAADAPTAPTPNRVSTSAPSAGADRELFSALQSVLQFGASDLHITVNAAPTLRIDGKLSPLPGAEIWGAERVATALRSLLTPKQRERFDTDLELDFSYQLSDNARFRVNFYVQRGHLGGAFRIIPTEIKPLAELGLPEAVSKFSKLPRGLVLVTGPTGSGKSTTLAALVELVNANRTDHIVTVEDPIEFLYTNKRSLVNQREVGHDTNSFSTALKHVLRQDPDVILIGELRDLETISVALTAAETGHLVFATLHTQDAAQTVDRIVDVFPPHQQNQVRTQLAATLQGVISQTLIKRMSGSGRVVATEVLFTTPAVSNLIREGKAHQIPSAMQAGGQLGMHTMDQSLADLVNSGTISLEVAMTKVNNLEVLKRLVTRESEIAQPFGQAVHDIDYQGMPGSTSPGSM